MMIDIFKECMAWLQFRRNDIHMRANMTQYKAPIIGRGMEATTAPNFPVHGQKK